MMGTRIGVWWVVVLAVVVVAVLGQDCTQMRQECRLKTSKTVLDNQEMVSLNVSCYCKKGEDVSRSLEEVVGLKCSWLPTAPHLKVNTSTLHISGCSVHNNVVPSAVWNLVRRSDHLEVWVEASPSFRLGAYIAPEEEETLPSLTATFINSKISGLPEGILGSSHQVEVLVEECELGVLETRSFSGYPSTANVSVTLVGTDILTLKMVAFELPGAGRVKMVGGRVGSWEESGYSGGSHLTLDGVRIGRLLSGAINIHGLQSFAMTNCTVATLYEEALKHKRLPQSQAVAEDETSSATFKDNNFVEANGKAFVNLCGVKNLVWHNNSFVNITMPPLRFQEPECETARDWKKIISLTGINCLNCEDFRNSDEQTCAIYETGYCTSCTELFDNCYSPALHLIINQCSTSHPNVVSELETNCHFNYSKTRPEPRSLTGVGSNLIPLSLLIYAGPVLYIHMLNN
nr:uncharacterized protein LOC123768471 [Procambarus clarkii]